MRRLAAACFAAFAVLAVQAQVSPPVSSTEIVQLLEGFGFAVHYNTLDEVAGVTTIEGLTVALKKADGTPDEKNMLTVSRVEAIGLDAEAIRTVFDPARYADTPDQNFRTLASHMTLKGIAFAAEGRAVFTIEAADFGGWEMKQFLWLVPGGPEFDRQFTTPLERLAKIFGNVTDSLRLTSSSLTGIHAEIDAKAFLSLYVPPIAAMPAMDLGPTIYDYSELTIGRIDRGTFGPMTMKGLSSSTPAPDGKSMRLKVREITVDGSDISKLLPYLSRADWPPIAEEGLLSYGAFCMRDYEIAMEAAFSVLFPEICSEPIRFVWLIPERLAFGGKGTLTLDPDAERTMPAYIAKYFTGPVEVSLAFALSYDRPTGIGAIDHYGFALGGFGGFDLRARIGGLELDRLAKLPDDYATQPTLNSGEVELHDEGGINALLDMAIGARGPGTEGQTPEQLKTQAKLGIDMMVGMLGNTPAIAAMGKAIKDFIDQGGTLVVRTEPPKPLSLKDLGTLPALGPSEIAKLLGLGGSHTPP